VNRDCCAYSIVKCEKGRRCQPKEKCPAGRIVYRDRYTSAGHHHLEEGDNNAEDPAADV
jgi:hypothetical protein